MKLVYRIIFQGTRKQYCFFYVFFKKNESKPDKNWKIIKRKEHFRWSIKVFLLFRSVYERKFSFRRGRRMSCICHKYNIFCMYVLIPLDVQNERPNDVLTLQLGTISACPFILFIVGGILRVGWWHDAVKPPENNLAISCVVMKTLRLCSYRRFAVWKSTIKEKNRLIIETKRSNCNQIEY